LPYAQEGVTIDRNPFSFPWVSWIMDFSLER
jgi:hypothetical protein